MAPKERTYVWSWWFDAPPSRVWPVAADTNRLNRLAGLSPARYAKPSVPERTASLDVTQRVLGVLSLAYDETPFDWVEGERYAVVRRFRNGPIARMDIDVRLVPEPRGTTIRVTTTVAPRSALTAWLVPLGMRRAHQGLDAAYGRLRDEVQGEPNNLAARRSVLRKALARLGASAQAPRDDAMVVPPDVAGLLATHVATADASDLRRLRPFALADRWSRPRRATLAAFLAAVRAGVLELSWESLCPHCRGGESTRPARSLGEVTSRNRCEACHVDFDVEFDRSLEAVFRPAADLRRVGADVYCLGGPRNTPHVLLQRCLAPRDATAQPESVDVDLTLGAGAYRVRAHDRAGSAILHVEDEPSHAADADVTFGRAEIAVSSPTLRAGRVRLRLGRAAPDDGPVVALLERVAWLDDVATALDVVSLPGFTDLFASEVLAPGERVAVRRIAILFTDLKGSTALYRRIGDAAAYALVREHFRVLRDAVRRHDGHVVKTIGDAVMASFRTPSDAVAAAVDMHRAVRSLPVPEGCEPLVLKAGVNQGPSIVVNAGGLLDFFGTTTNFAARAQQESAGGDVVVTEAVRDDEDVERLLATVPHRREPFRARPKGFEADVPLERIVLA